jgi:hypothetical protein
MVGSFNVEFFSENLLKNPIRIFSRLLVPLIPLKKRASLKNWKNVHKNMTGKVQKKGRF